VDAISGGTITSKALQEMLIDCMTGYVAYFKELEKK
jgi:Na+-transporting NADH:ubiquinone oxidoreductase subunit NqrC